ncbi:MAG: RNA polymerase sigma factor [Verrucomicrobiia bacterium]
MNNTLVASVSALFTISDEQAMWRVQMHDDAHAFAQLVHRWEKPIQRLCTRMLGDPQKGEDLTQDTFARIFARRKEYEIKGKFSTFLWRVALNLCYDELRRVRRRPETPLNEESEEETWAPSSFQSPTPGPDAQLVAQEQRHLVREAVLGLPDSYRTVVILRHYENLKFREIAEVLGIPEGTVKSRMAEALTQLHRLLSNPFQENQSALCRPQTKRIEENLVL